MQRLLVVALITLFAFEPLCAAEVDGNRLTYLDENNPYYVSRTFPKLITPQWVGEEGVEAVVVLAIDDMRDTKKYEDYLRPILIRLKQIDGRAPVSIMTCNVDPKDEQLQQWLAEGLSIECHTVDHPCPLLHGGDFNKAKSTYDRCIDLMHQIPDNKPVAFRMPCCDSLNTVSPRFYAEIFNKTTEKENFLSIDTSVFNVFTADDPEIPRELILDADGKEKFRKYIPKGLQRGDKVFDTFVNYVENYPYPYVINRLCWEFPCLAPSDWSAQHYHGKHNPQTVADWKAALDITVIKQGVLCLVFHPHGWIRSDQIVELIDHAVEKHGGRVKFLTFGEAAERLTNNAIGWSGTLRATDSQDGERLGGDEGVRLLDVNYDGYQDVIVGFSHQGSGVSFGRSRIWSPERGRWDSTTIYGTPRFGRFAHFGILLENGFASYLMRSTSDSFAQHFSGKTWLNDDGLFSRQFPIDKSPEYFPGHPMNDRGLRFRDFDGDGACEMLISDGHSQGIFSRGQSKIHFRKLGFTLPKRTGLASKDRRDLGLRFVDLNEDGRDDVVFSNHERYGIWLFKDMQTGWSIEVLSGKRGEKPAEQELPPIVREDGSDNGFFVHSRHLFWQNEDTAELADLVDRRSFDELLKDVEPEAKSPEQSLRLIEPRPGFKVELMAAEPLVMDPVAFEWGPDGKLWVVEMADYPLGIDGKGKPGGRVRFLEDTDEDGEYDKSTVFLNGVPFPSGVMPWRKGVLVSAAPDIFYAQDTDGDGKADVREVLYRGFGEGNQQHRVNGFAWGLDNWIYCANGDSEGVVKSLKTGETINIRGRDFRIRPNTGEIETQTGRTQFGRNRDDWGNWFGCNNSHPIWHFVLDEHYLNRNPHFAPPVGRLEVPEVPGAAPCFPISRTLKRFNDPDKRNRITSACSVLVYRDELFEPPESRLSLRECAPFRGAKGDTAISFVCEPVHNLVHREVLSAKGVTFTSRRAVGEEEAEFLASRDNWFRPTMVKTGPDGALWIADMYRQVIEHPEWIPDDWEKRLDLRAGHDRGRLYRVFPVDRNPRSIPRLDRMTSAELVSAFDSPNGWQRDTAQRLLVERQDKSVVPVLKQTVKSSPRPLARLHALCTLDGLDSLSRQIVAAALDDQHAGVRRHAVRLTESFADDSALLEKLSTRVDDADPQVQLQLAYTLGEWKGPHAAEVLSRLTVKLQDDEYHTAAVLSSVHQESLAPLLTSVLLQTGADQPVGKLVEKLLGLAAAFEEDQALVEALQQVTAPTDENFAAWQFAALAEVFDALERRGRAGGANFGLGEGDAAKTTRGQIAHAIRAARMSVQDSEREQTERIAAVGLLVREPDTRAGDIQQLGRLLVPQSPSELQLTAVDRLAQLNDEQVPSVLLDGWKSHGPQLRSRTQEVLLSRRTWTIALLSHLESGTLLPGEIDAARRERLLRHVSFEVRNRAAKLFAGAVDANRQSVVDAYASVLNTHGDIERGAKVFEKRCATCHKLNGVGKALGPDLAALKDRSPKAQLIALLDPNRAVETKFHSYTAVTRDGRTHTGLLTSESGNSITLASPDGKQTVLLREELELLASSGKSFMPDGLEKDLSPQDVADVIAYVGSAKESASAEAR